MFSYITFSDAELLAAFTALIACSPTPPIILILVHLLRTLILSISRRRLPLLCTLLVQQILNGRCNLRVYPSVVQYPLYRLPRHLPCNLFLAPPCGAQIRSVRLASQ